jgi:hypothetical protein
LNKFLIKPAKCGAFCETCSITGTRQGSVKQVIEQVQYKENYREEKMGYFGINVGEIGGFEVEEIVEGGDHKVLHLSITNYSGLTKYRIHSDTREPDLNLIKKNLEEGFQLAKDTDNKIIIHEYLQRAYIFVEYPNGETKQYSAQRLL